MDGPDYIRGPWKLIRETRNPLYREAAEAHDAEDDLTHYVNIMQECCYSAGPDGDSDFVADVVVSATDVGIAQARLIAASPELLEACEDALRFLAVDCKGVSLPIKVRRVAGLLSDAVLRARGVIE